MSVYYQNIFQHSLFFWCLHFVYDIRFCNNIAFQTCSRFRSVWALIVITFPSFSGLIKPACATSLSIILHRPQWSQQKPNLPSQYQIVDLSSIEEFSVSKTWYSNLHTTFHSEIISFSLTAVQHDQVKHSSINCITLLSVP